MYEFNALDTVEVVFLGFLDQRDKDLRNKLQCVFEGMHPSIMAITVEYGGQPVTLKKITDVSQPEQNKVIEVNVDGHANFSDFAEQAIRMARLFSAPVNFDFNRVFNTVTENDTVEEAYARLQVGYEEQSKKYKLEREAYLKTPEGIAELAEDARKAAEAQKARAEAEIIAEKTEFKVSNQAAWDNWRANNTDGYGGAVISYAERWAKLMQHEMNVNGKTLEDVAQKTSHVADFEGITGFMYGQAVSALSDSWAHGEQLRKWHNKDYGVTEENDKGGVVNPAILTVAVADGIGGRGKPAPSAKGATPV